MSSTVKPQTLGRRLDDGQDRSVMLSRLGITQLKPSEPEPQATQVEALAASPPEETPPPTPALNRLRALVSPANDERAELAAEEPALAIPAPPPEPAVEEDPFAAIRERYRNPPKGMTFPAGLTLPTSIPLPEMPKVPLKLGPIGERRRKAGELSVVRKIIWGLSTLAALTVGWALLKADESSLIIQLFNKLML